MFDTIRAVYTRPYNAERLLETLGDSEMVDFPLLVGYPRPIGRATDGDRARYAFGYDVKGLRCVCTDDEIIINGSLHKFHHGNNACKFTRTEVVEAIERLETYTRLPIRHAEVSRFDFAVNVYTERDVKDYLLLMENVGKMNRVEESKTSIRFQDKGKSPPRVIAIYDKLKEMRSHGEAIHAVYDGMNVLRFEVRRQGKRAIKKQFGRIVTLADLYDPNFYTECQAVIWNDYKLIEQPMINNNMEMTNEKQVTDGVLAEGLKAFGGLDGLVRRLKTQAQPMDAKRLAKVRLKFRALEKKTRAAAEPHPLTTELNRLMEDGINQL